MLRQSGLSQCAQEILGEYILLKQYFISENVAKAVKLDTMESDQLTTRMLVKKCVKKGCCQ